MFFFFNLFPLNSICMRYNTIALDRIGSSFFSFLSRPNYFLVWIYNDSIRCLLGGSFFFGAEKSFLLFW
jgi:hypothetical protein